MPKLEEIAKAIVPLVVGFPTAAVTAYLAGPVGILVAVASVGSAVGTWYIANRRDGLTTAEWIALAKRLKAQVEDGKYNLDDLAR